jgi:mannosyltransferase
MLIVHSHFHPRRTGVTRHVEEIVEAQQSLGEVRAIGNTINPALPRVSLGEIWSRSKNETVVFHAHRNLELLLALVIRWFHPGLKIIWTRHGWGTPSKWTVWLSRKADRVILLTDWASDEFGRKEPIVNHGVDVKKFTPPPDREAAWQSGRFGIGVIGRIRPKKGQGDFIAAAAPLLEKHKDWQGVLVGLAKPQHRAWADSIVASTNGRVVLAGEHREVPPWYRGLSILVQPSHGESYSLVTLEALSSGCCVVAARLPHYGMFIKEGETGFLYELGNVEELRKILEGLLADPGKVKRIGDAAAADVRARFGIEREVQALDRHYREVAQAR